MLADHKKAKGGRRSGQRLRFAGEVLAALVVLVLAVLVRPAGASPLDMAMDDVFTVRSADAEDRFLGSAFLWGDGAVAVTNAHVVGDAEDVRLVNRHGIEDTARVIARDPVRDVAVIAVRPGRSGLSVASRMPGLGDQVFALGAPLGIAFTLTEGRISATERQVDDAVPLRMLQHDAAVNPGSSGGPLVDAGGQLVGMNSQIADGSRMFVGIAFAIAAADLDHIVTGLIDETLPPVPHFGMTARPVDRQVASALGVATGGLLVDSVTAGGLAGAAGLKAGDIILSLGGIDIAQPGDLAFAVQTAGAAGPVTITIRRGSGRLDLSLVLDAATDDAETGLRLRQATQGVPGTVTAYRLAALGLVLDAVGAVTAVTDNSPALFSGLAPGDRIITVNGAVVDLAQYEVTAPVLILVQAPGGDTRHIHLDPWAATDGVRPPGGANVLDPDVVVF